MPGDALKTERYTDEARSLFDRAQRRADGDGHLEVTPLHLFAELVAAHPAAFRSASVDPAPLLERIEIELAKSARGGPPARFDGSMQELVQRVEKVAGAPARRVSVAHVAQALFEKRAIQALPGAVIPTSAFDDGATDAPSPSVEGASSAAPIEAPLPRPAIASAPTPPDPPWPGAASGPTATTTFQRVATELRHPTARPSWMTLVFLVVSLVLFVASLGESNVQSILMIVGVLLFHECGHWIGMRLFGYRDVRMFFIPFFGAAVSGDPDGVASYKRGIVLLLGPLPGIVLACAIALAFGGTPVGWLRTLALTLAVVNALNLLPFEPLDGGRLVQLVLASRARFVEIVSVVAAAAGLAWLAVRLDAKALYVVAALTLLGVGQRIKVLAAAKTVRAKHAALPARIAAATDDELADVLAEVLEFVPHPEPVSDARIKTLAAATRQVYGRATSTAPGWSVSLALGAAQLVGFGLGVGALVLTMRSARAGGPIEPLSRAASWPDGSITLHHPASFTATRGNDATSVVVSRTVQGHLEVVSITLVKGADDARFAADALAQWAGGALTVGSADQCRGKPGVELKGVFIRANGVRFANDGCVFAHQNRLFHVQYLIDPTLEGLERPQLLAIIDSIELSP